MHISGLRPPVGGVRLGQGIEVAEISCAALSAMPGVWVIVGITFLIGFASSNLAVSLRIPNLENGSTYYDRLRRRTQWGHPSQWTHEVAVTPDAGKATGIPKIKGMMQTGIKKYYTTNLFTRQRDISFRYRVIRKFQSIRRRIASLCCRHP
jgi:hypothetical protein